MAINFSASFAACLAAGLKVPRQIMYCISQDTGAPYVLYKDSQEAGDRPATLGGQWSSDVYPQIQQQQQQQQQNPQAAHIPAQLAPAQPPHSPPNHDGSGGQSQTEQQNGNLPSPATSPYPQNGEIEEDVNTINQVQNMQHQQQAQGQTQQSSPDGNIEIPNDQQQQQQHQQQHQQAPQGQQQSGQPVFVEPTQAELNGYYAQRHPGAPQGTIMAPPGFPPLHHYLNKQGILPGMGGMEQSNGTLDGYSMPDLLHSNQLHHQTSPNTKPSKNSDLRLFKCLTCGKDFKQKSTLLQHERIHTDTRPYGCGECGKRFRQQSHLTQHLRIHANEKPFSCAYCPRSFRQRAILNQHIRIHSGEKPFICGVCTKAFRQKAILNQHVRTHQDVSPHLLFKNGTLWPSDIPFPEEPKDEQGNVIAQGGRKSRKGTSRKSIAIIFPTFYKDENGVNHSSGRSAGMPLWVRCPICIKDFRQKSTLLQHGCIHIESRPYPCGSCGKRFRQQSHLTQHLRIHTNEKPYGCVYCPRYFRQRTILNQHIRIHTGEKPYKCGQCGKDFRQKAILDQHTRTHQGDRPFCCPMPNCRRRFATEQEVKKHIDNHMNPNTKRNRNAAANAANQEAKNAANAAAAAAQFLSMDNKNNLIPRMGPVVKHELYFPQCYAPPFNQAFVAGANGTPNGAVVNGQQPQQQQQQQQQHQQQQQQQQPQAAHTNSVVVSTVVTSAPAVAQ